MSTILLTLNSNFTDPSDLDKKVKNVFKMFQNHLKNTASPISKESDMESIYEYNKLTPDNIRIFKKLAESNKSVLNLKELKVDGNKIKTINNDSCSESDSDTEDSPSLPIVFKAKKNNIKIKKVDESDSEIEKDDKSESEKDSESEIESEKDSESESEKDSESEIESEKDFGGENESNSESDSEIDTMKSTIMTELSTKIDDMQSSIKNIESILSKFK